MLCVIVLLCFFFFKQKTAYEMRISDWSSDVCSSDLAARAAAGFMAGARGEAVGNTVGYRIRFENKVSAATRIEVVTEGILTRMIQDDPMLDGVAALIFDALHECHTDGDLGLALALAVSAPFTPELGTVVMATMAVGERRTRYLAGRRGSRTGTKQG